MKQEPSFQQILNELLSEDEPKSEANRPPKEETAPAPTQVIETHASLNQKLVDLFNDEGVNSRPNFKPNVKEVAGAYRLRSSHKSLDEVTARPRSQTAPAQATARPSRAIEPTWPVAALSTAARLALDQLEYKGNSISARGLKKAFRRLALELHPDIQPHKPIARARDFVLIQEAYEIVSANLRELHLAKENSSHNETTKKAA